MTIDHLTGGRFSLNVVTGWYRPEIEMFGEPQMEHDERYDRAVEWLDVIKQLWTREEEFDFDGRYYTIKKGWLAPKPVQKPYPAVMNAGGSDKGRHYAAKYCDVAFTVLASHKLEDMTEQVARYRRLAREEYGREIQVWTNAYIVQGETEKDARDFFNHYVHAQGDWEAVDNLVTMLGINAQSLPPGVEQQLKEHFIAGWGGFPVVGSQGAGGRQARAAVEGGLRRRRAVLGALRRRDARVPDARRCRSWCRRGCGSATRARR